MVRHTVHLFQAYLCRTDIHVAVHLHRIRADDLAADPPGKLDGQRRFSDCCRSGQDNQGLFFSRLFQISHKTFSPFNGLYNPFEFLLQLIFAHRYDRWASMWARIRIFEFQKLIDQLVRFGK